MEHIIPLAQVPPQKGWLVGRRSNPESCRVESLAYQLLSEGFHPAWYCIKGWCGDHEEGDNSQEREAKWESLHPKFQQLPHPIPTFAGKYMNGQEASAYFIYAVSPSSHLTPAFPFCLMPFPQAALDYSGSPTFNNPKLSQAKLSVTSNSPNLPDVDKNFDSAESLAQL